MLKTGICTINDLQAKNTRLSIFNKPKKASITLYEQACREQNADYLTQRILLLFADERGAYKRTYSARFEQFDQEISNILQRNFDLEQSITIHDAGVSDGRTAVDFFHKINQYFSQLKFTASDYNPTIKIINKGRLHLALTESNQLLEIFYPPFVFNIIKRDSYRHYPLNHAIRKIIELFMVRPILKDYKNGKLAAKKLFLFAPTAINLAKDNNNFNLAQHDILQDFTQQYNVIRAMNVLNLSYFTDEQFPTIVNNIFKGLKDNGLLITGSNQEADTTVDGAVYKKSANGFELLWQSGNGSPIHSFIANYNN
jgi:chemotaxis methyl-accepting protein methylase